MKRVFILFLMFCMLCKTDVYASDMDSLEEFYDEANLSEAEEIAQDAGISFKELIHRIYNQDTSSSSLWETIWQALFDGIADNYEAMRQVFLLAILGAMLQALSQVFGNRQIGTMGFYVCYLCLMGFLLAAFMQAETIAQNLLTLLLEFMRALLPAYYLGLVMTLGSANGFYGIVLTALSLIEEVMKNLLIPGTRLYLILMLLNDLQEEDSLSKMAELVKTVLDWSMKTIFAGVIGLQLVQSLISPYVASVSQNLLVHAASAIPGIGNSVGAVSSVVLGSSMLIRNTVGVAAIVVVLFLCGVPIVQMVVITLLYQTVGAVIQPFADKRMVRCVTAVAAAVKLLMKLVMLSALILIITLAILCATKSA